MPINLVFLASVGDEQGENPFPPYVEIDVGQGGAPAPGVADLGEP